MTDMQKFVEDLRGFDVNDIDFNRVGVWPLPGKVLLALIASAAIIGACYFFMIKDKQASLDTEASKEQNLRSDFTEKAHEAANLQTYRDQMVEMEESFGALVSRLPSDTEVPGLLEDIDDKGVESRLVINKISLKPEQAKQVHIELPIEVNVSGGYHEFGAFVSGVAGMPRIVTLHDFEIRPESGDSGLLVMQMTAKTYRYKRED